MCLGFFTRICDKLKSGSENKRKVNNSLLKIQNNQPKMQESQQNSKIIPNQNKITNNSIIQEDPRISANKPRETNFNNQRQCGSNQNKEPLQDILQRLNSNRSQKSQGLLERKNSRYQSKSQPKSEFLKGIIESQCQRFQSILETRDSIKIQKALQHGIKLTQPIAQKRVNSHNSSVEDPEEINDTQQGKNQIIMNETLIKRSFGNEKLNQSVKNSIENKSSISKASIEDYILENKLSSPVTKVTLEQKKKENFNIFQDYQQQNRILIKSNSTFFNQNGLKQNQYGLRNLGNTCYINSGLQMLKQMQKINPKFLDQQNSQFANQLKIFFEELDLGYNVDKQLQKIVQQSKSMQTHEMGGGDSYLTAYKFLELIISQTSKSQSSTTSTSLSKFQQIFSIKYGDGMLCQKCKQYLTDENVDCPYFEEINSSLDVQNFDQVTKIESVYGQDCNGKYFCKSCSKYTNFRAIKAIQFYPEFLIVKFPSNRNFTLYESKCQEIQFTSGLRDIISYELIGYCNYSGSHYTYTAKENQSWITYNDSLVYSTSLNLNLAIHLLYLKN